MLKHRLAGDPDIVIVMTVHTSGRLLSMVLCRLTPRLSTGTSGRIDTQLRRQKCGGAIGSDATEECARLYMLSWDRKLKKKLKKLGLKTELYCRYVDDILCALDAINIGWDYDAKNGRMIYRPELL